MSAYDLVVIGAGPGGYVAAIRAAQLGMSVACVEQESLCGGTCLRIGCIPSKALLESSEHYAQARDELAGHGVLTDGVRLDLDVMMRRKEEIVQGLGKGIDGLLKKNKITRVRGRGRLSGPGMVEVDGADAGVLEARRVLLATGSRSAPLKGVTFDGDRIGTSTEALAYPEVPEHLVVVGAGYIGLELGSVWRRLGARVTVLEYLPRILPGMDADLAKVAHKLFEKQGIEFRLGVRVTGAQAKGKKCTVEIDGDKAVTCDRVLVAVGRVPNTDDLGLDTVGIRPDAKGRLVVNDSYMTSASEVYAVGDLIDGPMLAHKAEEEGVACVEAMATGHGHVDYGIIPAVCYTHPEIATVGRTEEALREVGIDYRKGVFPFLANGRARSLGCTDGMVKILADAATDRVLGVHILGPRAGDLIAEAAVAMAFGASSEDIALTCHAHPTLAETVREAALAVDGRALHA